VSKDIRGRPFLTAAWRDLAMINFAVDPTVLRPLLPPGTELDRWQGVTLVSLVGFHFDATRVLGLEIWRNAFVFLKYGYATAMGWLLASLLIGFTIFQLRYLSKVQFRLAKSD
jgi:hypothetical protein